jgi:hypothetical protein
MSVQLTKRQENAEIQRPKNGIMNTFKNRISALPDQREHLLIKIVQHLCSDKNADVYEMENF